MRIFSWMCNHIGKYRTKNEIIFNKILMVPIKDKMCGTKVVRGKRHYEPYIAWGAGC